MKCLIILACLAALGLASGDKYTDRYDNINIEEILSNKRLLGSYIKCILDKGRCTPEGKALKEHVKDAMQTACSKCTQWQRLNSRKVVKHIREKEVENWEELKQKFDPDDQYKETYEGFLAGSD